MRQASSRMTIIAIVITMIIIVTITIIIILIIIPIISSSSSYLTIIIINNISSSLYKYITIIFIKITFRRSQQHDYLEVKALVLPLSACSTWKWRSRTHECLIDALSVEVVVLAVVENEESVSDRWLRKAI